MTPPTLVLVFDQHYQLPKNISARQLASGQASPYAASRKPVGTATECKLVRWVAYVKQMAYGVRFYRVALRSSIIYQCA